MDGGPSIKSNEKSDNPNMDAVMELLSAGANVNAEGKFGMGLSNYTPLMLACMEGHVEVAKVLLDHGAQLDLRRKGRTALWMAVQSRSESIVRLLKDRGAGEDVAEIESTVLLIQAASKGFREKEGEPYPPYPGVPLGADVAPALDTLDLGALNLNCTDPEGYTPLMYAANLGLVENVRLLIAAGADVAKATPLGYTAISMARNARRGEVVKLLEKHGE